MKKRITLFNIITSLLMQLIGIISGLIVPRLILASFGSNVNGLVSSIGQFLKFISLVEGGITGVIMANLYKPLVDRDMEKASSVLVAAKKFYQKIAYIFIVYTIIIGLIYPLFVDSGFSYWYVFTLTCIISIGTMLEYMVSLTLSTLLNADKKAYVISLTTIVTTILNIGITYVVVRVYPDVILLKFASSILFVIKPIVYSIYIKKNYDINWKANQNNELIKERWNGFAINFAFFIHSCTDITILTFLTDLKTVSVYGVYNLIIGKVNILVHSLTASIEPTIGHAYAKADLKEMHDKMDLYEFIIFFAVGFLFSITGLLITPFVMIYTRGITDADYYQPLFAAALVLAEALYLLRSPHVSLAYSANRFKDISIPAYIEAGINIVASLILVKIWGILGVSIGTVLGMAYRMVFHVHYTHKIIPDRRPLIFYKKLVIISGMVVLGIVISNICYPFTNFTLQQWVLHGIFYSFVFGLLALITSICFFNKEIRYILKYISNRRK